MWVHIISLDLLSDIEEEKENVNKEVLRLSHFVDTRITQDITEGRGRSFVDQLKKTMVVYIGQSSNTYLKNIKICLNDQFNLEHFISDKSRQITLVEGLNLH